MAREEAAVFDTSYVIFFERVPDSTVLKPNQIGVNRAVFDQLKTVYKKAKHNSAYRILADICQDIGDDGLVGSIESSAQRLSIHGSTINRWRHRFADQQILIRHKKVGAYSVSPKVAIRLDEHGKVVKAKHEKPILHF